nr:FtsX-like permease family protein [Tessaracoccus coleopterorum]
MFKWLGALQWATITMSALLLLAGALQIANTIRMAAFTRRREIGIMRLVGASNIYILLPFLLESLVAGLIGVVIAAGSLAAGYYFVVVQNAQTSITALPWIGWAISQLPLLSLRPWASRSPSYPHCSLPASTFASRTDWSFSVDRDLPRRPFVAD